MWFSYTTRGGFGFGAVFYDALVLKIFKALVLYSNTMHQVGVYGAHSVRCANVLCALVLSLFEHTSVVYDNKRTGRKTSAKTLARQPPLETDVWGIFIRGSSKTSARGSFPCSVFNWLGKTC